jgi:hypothetical protein
MADRPKPDDASLHVMELLQRAKEPLSTEKIVAALQQAHDEAAVLRALYYWRDKGDAEQLADRTWVWIGPRDRA